MSASRVVARASVVAALTALLLSAGASPAAAHARLARLLPGDGAVVTTAPSSVELQFDEDVVHPSTVVVLDESGAKVSTGTTTVSGRAAVVRVGIGRPGRYTVAYRVLSADGHVVTGESSFSYRPGGQARAGDTSPSDASGDHASGEHAVNAGSSWDSASGVLIAGIAGLALLIGVALLTTLRRSRRATPADRGSR